MDLLGAIDADEVYFDYYARWKNWSEGRIFSHQPHQKILKIIDGEDSFLTPPRLQIYVLWSYLR